MLFLASASLPAYAEPLAKLNSPRRTLPLETVPNVAVKAKSTAMPRLPPVPEGVTDLKFTDFFKTPVGDYGLEVTDRLKSLNGRKVRILGWQVVEAVGSCNAEVAANTPARKAKAWFEASVPGRLLLAPTPQWLNYAHYGQCDDLPPQVIYVTVPEMAGQPVPHTPGLLLLTGTLEVGNKEETDGRISVVRLRMDSRSASPVTPQAPQITTR